MPPWQLLNRDRLPVDAFVSRIIPTAPGEGSDVMAGIVKADLGLSTCLSHTTGLKSSIDRGADSAGSESEFHGRAAMNRGRRSRIRGWQTCKGGCTANIGESRTARQPFWVETVRNVPSAHGIHYRLGPHLPPPLADFARCRGAASAAPMEKTFVISQTLRYSYRHPSGQRRLHTDHTFQKSDGRNCPQKPWKS